ncbi:MAG: hypothetical protein K8W52_24855 [Deltaproteobacteria bacterium]|nr:hypothetical protein [Deltaproteobacteria bacterium]
MKKNARARKLRLAIVTVRPLHADALGVVDGGRAADTLNCSESVCSGVPQCLGVPTK